MKENSWFKSMFLLLFIMFYHFESFSQYHKLFEKYDLEMRKNIGQPDTMVIFFENFNGYNSLGYSHQITYLYKKDGRFWYTSAIRFEKIGKHTYFLKSNEVRVDFSGLIDSLLTASQKHIAFLHSSNSWRTTTYREFTVAIITPVALSLHTTYIDRRKLLTSVDPVTYMHMCCLSKSTGFKFNRITKLKKARK